jgi:integrase/ribosomal protein L40E
MARSSDIHDYQSRLDSVLRRLESEQLILDNKKAILRFKEQLEAEGISTGRIFKYVWTLRNISKWLGKPFKQATKEDIVKLVAKINLMKRADGKLLSVSTTHEYQVSLKRFYRFLYGMESGDYPQQVKWIKLTMRKRDQKLPEELLTEEEVQRMARLTDNSRDRALVLILYESGCRVSEILTLKVKHVQFDDYGARLIVEGKTGMRPVRIVGCEPELKQWMNDHPIRDSPEANLWIPMSDKNKFEDKSLTYVSVNHMLKRLAKRAGIKKRVHPHIFRHSRATHLANKLTEQELKKMFGWTQDSRVASTYVHLSMRDIDEKILQINGIKVEEGLKPKFTAKICPRCKTRNSAIAKFCSNCSFVLDAELAYKGQEATIDYQKNLSETFRRMAEHNPGFVKEFDKIWEEVKLEQISKKNDD